MTTAFVLSGGASLGAVQVGMLRALAERDIAPDLLVGTSAGALNAAYAAGHGPDCFDSLARVWNQLNVRTLFAVRPLQVLRALTGRNDAVCSDHGLRALIDKHLTFSLLEDAPIPLRIVATDLMSGEEVVLRTGDTSEAILASCAIPGVFPAVLRGQHALVDGGLANNTAVSQAVEAGADIVYVLPSGYSCALPEPPRTPLAALTHSLALLIHQRLVVDVAKYSDEVDLIVIPPPCPIAVSAIDFGHSPELIHCAYVTATAALSRDGGRRPHPERAIAMHTHQAGAM